MFYKTKNPFLKNCCIWSESSLVSLALALSAGAFTTSTSTMSSSSSENLIRCLEPLALGIRNAQTLSLSLITLINGWHVRVFFLVALRHGPPHRVLQPMACGKQRLSWAGVQQSVCELFFDLHCAEFGLIWHCLDQLQVPFSFLFPSQAVVKHWPCYRAEEWRRNKIVNIQNMSYIFKCIKIWAKNASAIGRVQIYTMPAKKGPTVLYLPVIHSWMLCLVLVKCQ